MIINSLTLAVGIIATIVALLGNYAVAKRMLVEKKRGMYDVAFYSLLLTTVYIVCSVLLSGIFIRNLGAMWLTVCTLGLYLPIIYMWRGSYFGAQEQLKNFTLYLLRKVVTSYLLVFVTFLLILSQSLILTRIVLAPDNVFDSQVYHLPIPAQWHQENRIDVFEPVPVERIRFSTKAPKTLSYWVLAYSNGNTALIELSQYFGIILLLLSAYSILRKLEVSRKFAFTASVFILFIPIVLIESRSLQDHVFLTGLHFALMKVIFDVLDKKFRNFSSGIAIAGLSAGLLLAGKFSAPAHVASIGVVVVLFYGKDVFNLLRQSAIKEYMKGILTSIFAFATLGLSWYVLNYYMYGSFFGPHQPQTEKQGIFLTNILEMPQKFFEYKGLYNPDLVDISGYGPFAVTIGILCTLWALFDRKLPQHIRKPIRVLFLSTVLVQMFYYSVYLTPYNYRLLITMPVMLIIVAMTYVYHMSILDRPKGQTLANSVLFFGALSMLFTFTTTIFADYSRNPVRMWKEFMYSYPEDRTVVRLDYGTDKYKNDNSFLFIDQFLPRNEPIMYVTQHEPGYDDLILLAYYGNNLERRSVWAGNIENSAYVTPQGVVKPEMVQAMCALNIRYLHNNSVYFKPEKIELTFKDTPQFKEITNNLYYLQSCEQKDSS